MNIMLAWNRGLGFAWQNGIVSPAYSVFSVVDGSEPKFLDYLVRSDEYTRYYKAFSAGVIDSRLRLYPEVFGRLTCALPNYDEQAHIATFLDHETSRIDALVEEQQRLIELLKEKRQAVISHAVTKGLDPDVPMKDSGVEWLGEVPAHWEVKPLRHLGECQNGINIGADAFGSGFPFVSYGDVYKNEVLPTNPKGLVQSSREDRERYSIKKGDVLFTRTLEMVEEIGFSSTCFQDIPSATFAGFLIRFRPDEGVLSPSFSRYFFGSQRLREFFVKEMEIVTRASLGQDLLKRMSVPIAPIQEQVRTAQHLDAITQKIDSLLDQARAAIKLLAERRSALISAAVTGKIDVRGWQPLAGSSVTADTTQSEMV
ncbi:MULTISPECIES: restriction endonuclease subunit S [Halomonas]|nr:restriction endonuclease subunit S [Halomonas ventosae]